ncbi:B-cell receptor CD22 isoform X2 [Paralichthys olivaceus]|uniref:B-cell receptor CD22 isoform X2 n=1 Tax=Paralichthys olivaceus TaxID=8255 RepID=UPI003751096F
MEAQTVTWFVFLVLTKYVSTSYNPNPFQLKPGSTTEATEGSCFEIKCSVIKDLYDRSAYWFWMKDAKWVNNDFSSTVIYSSNSSKRAVSPDFANRVKFIGSSSSSWRNGHSCSILICDLRTSDSGWYSLRYVGTGNNIWKSEDMTLNVKENQCLLTFKEPPVVAENKLVTLTCSTPTSCPSNPCIQDVTQLNGCKGTDGIKKSTTYSFMSRREDDKRVFSCKTQDNTDTYLIRNITVTVEYSPDVEIKIMAPVSAVKRETKIIVTNAVTLDLTCDVKRSNPRPDTYTWLKDGAEVGWIQNYTGRMIQPGDTSFYICEATNRKGTGRSKELQLDVQYKPRGTKISVSGSPDHKVKVNQRVKFTCNTEANPAPRTYFWYKHNYSQWKTTGSPTLDYKIQRADEACYRCRAINDIAEGDTSQPVCIQVLYPPTQPKLSMPAEVTEGQKITISCTAESFPPSHLTLTRINTSNHQSLGNAQEVNYSQPNNTLHQTFTVTSAHAGLYSCSAWNTEGMKQSEQKLVVKYPPQNVRVNAHPDLAVKENVSFTLICDAESHPPVRAVTWMKTTGGKDEIVQKNLTQTFTVNSANLSDSGLYSCEATNDMGTGKSQPAEVKVKYAPKNTNITGSAEKRELDGRSSVTLSCTSQSVPRVHHYTWYREIKGKKDEVVSNYQNHTVYSNQPGAYYCVAENEIDKRSSDSVHLFERDFLDILKFLILGLLVLIFLIFVVLILRNRRKKSIQQGERNTTFIFGYLCWRNGTRRRSLMNETVSAEPFRSRDDLLSENLRRPQAQRHQQLPDSTPLTNIDPVYSVVNLPKGASAQNGDTEADSVNYASLHFWKKPKNRQRQEEEHAVYAIVAKPKEPDSVQDYENISKATACAPKSPNLFDDGEDEVELNYSQVIFTAMPPRQMTDSDSSTSSEDESQYSAIRI